MNYLPCNDGIDHINIYSKGKTKLGKFLSNFTKYEIETEDGKFQSIEGYWYWVSTRDEKLRTLYGAEAKKYGRSLNGKDFIDSNDFKIKICRAIKTKIETAPSDILDEFIRSNLPFTHYYVYYNKVREVEGLDWLLNYIKSFRLYLKKSREKRE